MTLGGGYSEIMKFLDEVFTYYNMIQFPGTGMLPSCPFLSIYVFMYSFESFLYLSIYLYSLPYGTISPSSTSKKASSCGSANPCD